MALFTLAIGLAALTLLVFQLALMLRGETTWEHLRSVARVRVRVSHVGALKAGRP